jgi:MHS family alpha-ketoglutarate permease-like MFS transporter
VVVLAPVLPYFQPAHLDPATANILGSLVFITTLLGRPIGAFLFGLIADHIGRRTASIYSVAGFGIITFLIALVPGYKSIGIASYLLLVVLRFLDGIFLGGGYTGAHPLAIEYSKKHQRGFVGGFIIAAFPAAYVAINLVATAMFALVPLNGLDSPYAQWGWRIPFVIGALLAIFAAVMRRNLQETEAFVEAKKAVQTTGSIRGLLKYPRELLLVVGLTAGGTAAFYTFTTYMQTFVRLSAGLTEDQTTTVIFGSLIFATLLQPIYGALSDRIGRKPLLIFFGIVGTLATVPILTTLKQTNTPFEAFLLICAAWIFVAGYTSINAVVKAELFPTNVRALGVGLPYAITVSVFGGTAPAIALYFKSISHEDWFYYYLSGIIFLSLIIYSTMRDTKHESAMHRHE